MPTDAHTQTGEHTALPRLGAYRRQRDGKACCETNAHNTGLPRRSPDTRVCWHVTLQRKASPRAPKRNPSKSKLNEYQTPIQAPIKTSISHLVERFAQANALKLRPAMLHMHTVLRRTRGIISCVFEADNNNQITRCRLLITAQTVTWPSQTLESGHLAP